MKKEILLIAALLVPFAFMAQEQTFTENITENFVIGDFDNDGYINDIASFEQDFNLSQIHIFNSTGSSFYKNENIPWTSDQFDAHLVNGKIVAGDFDNDGFQDDIAAVSEVGVDKTRVFVWVNNDGVFEKASWWYGPDFNANQVFNTLVSGDFDNDGFVDDIAAFYDYQDYTTKVFVWRSNSKEFTWPATMWYGGDFDASRLQGTLVSGDFDHDGFKDDMAGFYNYEDNTTKIFLWRSTGRKFIWPHTSFYSSQYDIDNLVNNIVSGDFNRNGFHDDIVTFEASGNEKIDAKTWTISGLKFAEGQFLASYEGKLEHLFVGDFNNDSFVAEILKIEKNNDLEWNVYLSDKDYLSFPENWLTLKNRNVQTASQDEDIFTENIISVYPSIASNEISVDLGNSSKGTILLYNTLGEMVLQKDLTDQLNIVNVSRLAQGSYIYKIHDQFSSFSGKITIQ